MFINVQNTVIDGLDSCKIDYLFPTAHHMELKENALLAFLSPHGVLDKKFGDIIAGSIKTLIKIK